MKYFIVLVFSSVFLNASSYLAKIEPYDFHKIKSPQSGTISYVNKAKEFTYIKNQTVILNLDIKEESITLENLMSSLKIQKEILRIHEINFDNKQKITHLSSYEKSQEKLRVLNSTQIISDLNKSIGLLKNRISKKEFSTKDMYLNEIYVGKDEYVDIGDVLYELYDFSKLKLTLFMREKDLTFISKKTVFVNDTKSDFTIDKISQVRDSKRLSTYKVILFKMNKNSITTNFGEVVKVEFK